MATTNPSTCLQSWPDLYVSSLPIEDLEQRIRNRAYELYEARGREDGHAVDDWLHAEEQIWELH
jgi:Protein of unknown function (DUF2934)